MRPLRLAFALASVSLVLEAPARGADAPAGPAAADVERAIASGQAYLRGRFAAGFEEGGRNNPVELVVLTLAKTGANANDPVFSKGLAALEASELRFTYRVALTAMALSEVNPRLYQRRLAHCAQWLVDTQLPAGEWGYPGTPAGDGWMPKGLGVEPPPSETAEGAAPAAPAARIVVKRRSTTYAGEGPKGDFSNTQFAVLGLRACRDAGVDVPAETWKAALGYLRAFQRPDGGWGYVVGGAQDEASYASLTCAGVCSAAIALHATGVKDPKADPLVAKGLAWMRKHSSVAENTGIDKSAVAGPSPWQCYHLYSLERAARVLGLAEVGGKPWYPAGAAWLLGAQQGDGRWDDSGQTDDKHRHLAVADTCFALLFLARATRPLTGK